MTVLKNELIRPENQNRKPKVNSVEIVLQMQKQYVPPPGRGEKKMKPSHRSPSYHSWWRLIVGFLQNFSVRHSLQREVGPGHRPESVERKEPRTNF